MPRKKVLEQPAMTVVRSFDEVPDFANEDEEDEFWATHDLSEELLDLMEPVPPGVLPLPRRAHPTAIRFDAHTLGRVRALAARRGKGYQTLLKEFVLERLYEEEKREGLVGGDA